MLLIPNTTYVIDVAFIVTGNNNNVVTWRNNLQQTLIPIVNSFYQSSGVNVRFNIVAVEPFSKYKNQLLCPTELEELSIEDGLSLISELVPAMKREFNADLVYGIYNYGGTDCKEGFVGGVTYKRPSIFPITFVDRWYSFGSINTCL